MSSQSIFAFGPDTLREIALDVLKFAREKGASDCSVEASEGQGLSIGVRKARVETIEQNRDKGVGVTVYMGARKGHASTSDFSRQALVDTVAAAADIARFTAEDPCAGLPEEELFERSPRNLELFHEWDIDAPAAIEIAKRAEQAAVETDARIRNSDGASVSAQHSHFVLANSRGFIGGYPYSRHYISCAPIAQRGRDMQRDDWYSSERDPASLAPPEAIGRYAAHRALSRLGGKPISTRRCPVLFEAPLACGLLGSFVQAASGTSLYRKSSFLVDALDRQVFADHIGIAEDPHVLGGLGSAPFDEEGVRTTRRAVVEQGIVRGWFLSSYSARKLGMRTTGNAGGSHNLTMRSSRTRPTDDFEAMLRKLDTGLLVTEVIGQGINYVTGDYSRGVSGFWVERGTIVHPVEEVTIAGNLKEMFSNIVAIGTDSIVRGTKSSGSVLIAEMTVAGA